MRTGHWSHVALCSAFASVGFGCPAPTPTPVAPAFHGSFPLIGAHSQQACEDCHVLAARRQGLAPEDDAGWVTRLDLGCTSCHPDDAPAEHHPGTCSTSGCHSVSDFCWAQVVYACDRPPAPTSFKAH